MIATRSFPDEGGLPTPDLPDSASGPPARSADDPWGRRSRSAPSSGSGSGFRVVALSLPDNGRDAGRRGPADRGRPDLSRLQRIELIVSLAVLAALAAAAFVAIRIGMRPLARIEDTAGAIAAGDLSQPRRGHERAHRGRTPRDRPQRDAHPDRAGVRRTRGERGAHAPVPRRRLARAAHAAELDPRLRGALPDRRRRRAGRPEDVDGADRGRNRSEWAGSSTTSSPRPAGRGPREPVREPVDLAEVAREVSRDALATERARSIELSAPATVPATGRSRPASAAALEPRRQRAAPHEPNTPVEIGRQRRRRPRRCSPSATTAPGSLRGPRRRSSTASGATTPAARAIAAAPGSASRSSPRSPPLTAAASPPQTRRRRRGLHHHAAARAAIRRPGEQR